MQRAPAGVLLALSHPLAGYTCVPIVNRESGIEQRLKNRGERTRERIKRRVARNNLK